MVPCRTIDVYVCTEFLQYHVNPLYLNFIFITRARFPVTPNKELLALNCSKEIDGLTSAPCYRPCRRASHRQPTIRRVSPHQPLARPIVIQPNFLKLMRIDTALMRTE